MQGLKTVLKNEMFWSEIDEDLKRADGGTSLRTIPKSPPPPPPRDGYCRNVDMYYPTVCNISSPCNQYILLKSNHAHTLFMLSEFVLNISNL